MTVRIGIELSPVSCRSLQLLDRPPGIDAARGTCVSAYTCTARTDPATLAGFASLKGRRAAVIVWGSTIEHRQVAVERASIAAMRAEARLAVAGRGAESRRLLADIAPSPAAFHEDDRRSVIVASAASAEIAAALRPLLAAGIKIDAVLTPAAALLSLARLRRPGGLGPDGIEAYVAIEETSICVALVGGGRLLAAREFPWGYVEEAPDDSEPPREEFASRLARDLAAFTGEALAGHRPLVQICLCGGAPDLGRLAVALMQVLDVEVEPLDSLFAIDTDHLPADEFQLRASEFRLAWAAAATRRPPLNLLREVRHRKRQRQLAAAALVAGVIGGVTSGFGLQARLDEGRPPLVRRSQAAAPAAADAPPPLWSHGGPEGPHYGPEPASAPLLDPPPTPDDRLAARVDQPPPVETPVPVIETVPRPVERQPPPVEARASGSAARSAPVIPPIASAPRDVRGQRPAVAAEIPLPFEANLETILFGPDRRLAIVDGRIVGPGDEVRGARVVQITPSSVLLRDEQGRLRRLTAAGSSRDDLR